MVRSNEPESTRLNDKDAFNVFRLLRAIDIKELAMETQVLLDHNLSQDVTAEAMSFFRDLFGTVTATGVQMIVRSVRGLEDPDVIAASAVPLALDLTSLISDQCRARQLSSSSSGYSFDQTKRLFGLLPV